MMSRPATKVVAVLTADIIGSSAYSREDRRRLDRVLRRAFADTERHFPKAIHTAMTFRITAGDEFQCVISDVTQAFTWHARKTWPIGYGGSRTTTPRAAARISADDGSGASECYSATSAQEARVGRALEHPVRDARDHHRKRETSGAYVRNMTSPTRQLAPSMPVLGKRRAPSTCSVLDFARGVAGRPPRSCLRRLLKMRRHFEQLALRATLAHLVLCSRPVEPRSPPCFSASCRECDTAASERHSCLG